MNPSGRVAELYDGLCRVIGSRGQGLTLSQMGDAHALARAIVGGDRKKMEEFRIRLGLSEEEMAP